MSSSTATYVIKNSVDLSFVSIYWHQFAAAFKLAKSLYTIISDTGIGIIIASQSPLAWIDTSIKNPVSWEQTPRYNLKTSTTDNMKTTFTFRTNISVNVSSQILLPQKIHKFKHYYHKFTSLLEFDWMMWRNSYDVALNGFILFDSWGVNKR